MEIFAADAKRRREDDLFGPKRARIALAAAAPSSPNNMTMEDVGEALAVGGGATVAEQSFIPPGWSSTIPAPLPDLFATFGLEYAPTTGHLQLLHTLPPAPAMPPRPGDSMYRQTNLGIDDVGSTDPLPETVCPFMAQYKVQAYVGAGSYGVVIRCVKKDEQSAGVNRLYACKLQIAQTETQRTYLREHIRGRYVAAINELRVAAILNDTLTPGLFSHTVEERQDLDQRVYEGDRVWSRNVVRLFDWTKCTIDVEALLRPLITKKVKVKHTGPRRLAKKVGFKATLQEMVVTDETTLREVVRMLYGVRTAQQLAALNREAVDHVTMIMEFVSGTDLASFAESSPYRLFTDEGCFAQLIVQTMCTLVYLQRSVKFTHYDCHPRNVLVESVPNLSLIHSSALRYQVILDTSDIGSQGQRWLFFATGERIYKLNDFGMSRVDALTPAQTPALRATIPPFGFRFPQVTASDNTVASPNFDASVDVHMLACGLVDGLFTFIARNQQTPVSRVPHLVLVMLDFMLAPSDTLPPTAPNARTDRQSLRQVRTHVHNTLLRLAQAQPNTPFGSIVNVGVADEIVNEMRRADSTALSWGTQRGDPSMPNQSRATPSAVLYRFAEQLGGVRAQRAEGAYRPPTWMPEAAFRLIIDMLPAYDRQHQISVDQPDSDLAPRLFDVTPANRIIGPPQSAFPPLAAVPTTQAASSDVDVF